MKHLVAAASDRAKAVIRLHVLLFRSHIDAVRYVNDEYFISGSQDGWVSPLNLAYTNVHVPTPNVFDTVSQVSKPRLGLLYVQVVQC